MPCSFNKYCAVFTLSVIPLISKKHMHVDDLCHQLPVWELDVVEYAAAQEGVGQLLLRIGGDNHDGALLCLNGFLCFGDIKFHFIQFPQKVVGKFQIGFIDFVNQQNDLLVAVERFAKLAKLDIFADIIHALIAELGIIQTLHNVIHIETILRLCGGFDIPDDTSR